MREAHSLEFLGNSRRFELLSRLGEGGVGVVYEAYDRERNTTVALKTLREPSAEGILLFKKEFRSLQDLHHTNLVELGELFEEDGTFFFTMERVEGVDFLQYVCKPRRAAGAVSGVLGFDDRRLRSALGQLTRALCALHGAEKVHRDIKPSNILVTKEGRVVILDFGIVADQRERRRRDEGIVGTALYMSPEQAAGEPIGPAADWYAVGAILYQALTGRPPFIGSAHDILVSKLTTEQSPRPRTLVPHVPRDLDELCFDLLRPDPADRPTGAEILQRLNVEASPEEHPSSARIRVFIGRQHELAELEDAYRTVTSGRAVTVFIHGESGVGKSFLVDRFTESVVEQNPEAVLLFGRCYEREAVVYKAFDGIVDDLTQYLQELPTNEVSELLPSSVMLLAQVFPVLRQVEAVTAAIAEGPTERTIINPQELRVLLFAGLRELLRNIARRRPLVLVVDDLQWADDDSFALLAEVMREPNAPPLLLIATQRVQTGSARRIKVEAKTGELAGDVRHIYVPQLPPDEARELVARLIGGREGDEPSNDAGSLEAEIEAIAQDTGGHPLFIDELVRSRTIRAPEEGVLRLDDAVWARVSRLSPAARKLIEVVCLAGVPISQSVAATAAALDEAEFFHLAVMLRAAHFVRATGVSRDDTIEAYHDRVRVSVVAHLDAESRKHWHGRIALALEEAKDADPESLAIHWQGAERFDRAAGYAVTAAEAASDALAFDRSARLYRFALELGTHLPTEVRAIKQKLAEALTNAGRGAEAAEIRLDLAKDADAVEALDLRRRAAEQFMCTGRFDRGVALLREVLGECHVVHPHSRVGLLVALIVARLALLMRGFEYRQRKESDVEPRALVRIDSARSAGSGFSMTDNVQGAYFQTRALLFALEAGDPHRILRALAMEVCFSASNGLKSKARTEQLLKRTQALAHEIRTPVAFGMASTAAGYYHYFLAEWVDAKRWLLRGEQLFRDRCIGVTFELQSTRIMLYRVLGYLGDIRELAARAPTVFREVEEQGDIYSSISLRTGAMAQIALAADAPDEVKALVAKAVESLPKSQFVIQHYFCFIAQTQLDLYLGNGAAAHERMSESWKPLRRSMLLRVSTLRIAGYEQRARCTIAAARSSKTDRERLLADAERTVRRLEREPLPWAKGSASLLHAGIAATRGNTRGAIEHLIAAETLLGEAHMTLYEVAARRRRGQLLGGEEGADLVRSADEWMREQQIVRPERFAAVIAPGFD